MTRIFLSYRRADSADITGRIDDRLLIAFGRKSVFKDVDSIPLGSDFRKHLASAVSKCDVLLVVIGKDWLSAPDESGSRRLDNDADYVRIEIETALQIEHASGNLPAGFRYALPTEAQWEYACRAGTDHETYGQPLQNIAWYENDRGPSPVGQKAPNPWGLYDMIGNVSEWCLDYYGPYQQNAAVDPTGAAFGEDRVIRGASFFSGRGKCNASFRDHGAATRGFSSQQTGFRVAAVRK